MKLLRSKIASLRAVVESFAGSTRLVKRTLELFHQSGTALWAFLFPVLGSFVSAGLEALTVALLVPISESIVQSNWEAHDLKLVGNIRLKLPESIAHSHDRLFMALVVAYFSLFVVKKMTDYVSSLSLQKHLLKAIVNLRSKLIKGSLHFGKAYYDRVAIYRVIEIILAGTEQLARIIPDITAMISSVLYAAVYIAIMVKISWQLTVIVAAMIPWFSIIAEKIRKTTAQCSEQYFDNAAKITAKISDNITCLPLIRANNQEANEINILTKYCDELSTMQYNLHKKASTLPLFQEVAGVSLLLLLLSAANFLSVRFHAPRGTQYLLYLFVLRRTVTALQQMGGVLNVLSGNAGIIARIENLINVSDKEIIPSGTKTFEGLKSGIEFKNLTFSYKDRSETLSNVSFTIEKGKMTAIVGHSGAGKTTIIQLIQRLYETKPGMILVDGTDISEFAAGSIRQLIAVVSQDSPLFNTTIRDNLVYGLGRELTEIETARVLKSVVLADLVSGLPQGLDTPIGERGVQLSGGEKQRLSLARALLKKADIVLLDEATSSLDVKTEQAVRTAIEQISSKQTVVLVAHRLSTIMRADKIVVMEKGTVVEQGTIDELMKAKGHFYELYQAQSFAA